MPRDLGLCLSLQPWHFSLGPAARAICSGGCGAGTGPAPCLSAAALRVSPVLRSQAKAGGLGAELAAAAAAAGAGGGQLEPRDDAKTRGNGISPFSRPPAAAGGAHALGSAAPGVGCNPQGKARLKKRAIVVRLAVPARSMPFSSILSFT